MYSGQFDLNVGACGTELLLDTLAWPGLQQYRNATRQIWRVAGNVVGYVKQAKSLTYAIVNGAGHMVPATQPQNSLDLISRFIKNQPYS
jgi:vitellogenic carboxypeptidase-like protein